MANMSYIRFQNTLADLRDCAAHITDDGLSTDEENARRRLIVTCQRIVDEARELDVAQDEEAQARV